MRLSGWPGAGIAALALSAAAAAGALGFWAATAQPVPASLATGRASVYAPVGEHRFADQRRVTVTVARAAPAPLVSPGSGRVTASSCAPGARIGSGSSPFALDGAPVLALATRVPLWRDLSLGDRGADVEALREELRRLGADLSDDGPVNGVVIAALGSLLPGLGDNAATVPASRILWLPAAEVVLKSCAVETGRYLGASQEVAQPADAITATVAPAEESGSAPLPGARTLALAELTVPLEGSVVSAEAAEAITRSSAYRQATAGDDGSVVLTGTTALAQPIPVGSVPPSAIYADEAGSSCVSDGATGHAVTVLGSQLGESFVVFAGAAPPQLVVHPRSRPSCS